MVDPFCHQPILPLQELFEEKEGGMVIIPDYNLWAKTADALTQLRTCGNSWQHSAGERLKKATGTVSELVLEILACHFLHRGMHTGPDKEMLLFDSRERWMVWQHVVLPPFENRQRPTGVGFLQQTVDKIWQLTIRAVAVVIPWRLFCNKNIVVWNRRTPLSTKIRNEDATRNTISWFLEIPNQFEKRMPIGTPHIDS